MFTSSVDDFAMLLEAIFSSAATVADVAAVDRDIAVNSFIVD